MPIPPSGITLVIPVFNEKRSLLTLISSLDQQSLLPDEIIWVDGGSIDETPEWIEKWMKDKIPFRIIRAGRAYPGKGRNLGTEAAVTEWIVYTDAGIILDKDWLKNLVEKRNEIPGCELVYGNFSPQVNNLFEKAAGIAYVPAAVNSRIRYRSVVSCLLTKKAWAMVGGFPDWRATEDLVFMEKLEKAGVKPATAPLAMARWELRPDLSSTFKKFDLYSKYNVWAGREANWHYGVLRQYIFLLLFLLGGIFHHWAWFLLIPGWFIARAAKRIWQYRREYKLTSLINPLLWLLVILITMVIDVATFSGWVKAIFTKKPAGNWTA